MTYILILMIGTFGVTTAEFNTKSACESAIVSMEKAVNWRVYATCVPKGM